MHLAIMRVRGGKTSSSRSSPAYEKGEGSAPHWQLTLGSKGKPAPREKRRVNDSSRDHLREGGSEYRLSRKSRHPRRKRVKKTKMYPRRANQTPGPLPARRAKKEKEKRGRPIDLRMDGGGTKRRAGDPDL